MGVHRRIKLLDVARHAGVSAATVSRAIAQPDLVSAATLARVRSSAARLGYVPDGAFHFKEVTKEAGCMERPPATL